MALTCVRKGSDSAKSAGCAKSAESSENLQSLITMDSLEVLVLRILSWGKVERLGAPTVVMVPREGSPS